MGQKTWDEDDEDEDALFAAKPPDAKPAAPAAATKVAVPLSVSRDFISVEMEGSAPLSGVLTCYFAGIHAPEEGVVGTSAWVVGNQDVFGKFTPVRTMRAVYAHGHWSACDRHTPWAALASMLTYLAEHRKDITSLIVIGDSELTVNQMRGQWNTTNWNLKKFKEKAEAAVVRFHTSDITLALHRNPPSSNLARPEAEAAFVQYAQRIGQAQLVHKYLADKEAAKSAPPPPKPKWFNGVSKPATAKPATPSLPAADEFFDDDPLPPPKPPKPSKPKKQKKEIAPRSSASYPPPPPPEPPAFGQPVKRRIVKKPPNPEVPGGQPD